MIHFLANYNPITYSSKHNENFNWSKWRNKFAQFYDAPETRSPDKLLVTWIESLIKKHNDPAWYKYYGDIGIVSNSMVAHATFRVAIKEGVLKPEEFETIYVHEDGRVWTIQVGKDGDCSLYPDGFFDTYESLLVRLL